MKSGRRQNFIALTAIQASNALLPLVLLPYLLRTLGAASYAEIVLAEAAALIALPFALYSFETDGVAALVGKDISTDSAAVSAIYTEILLLRVLFLVASALFICSIWGPLLDRPISLVALWLMTPLGYVLQSSWLFQGILDNVPQAIIIVSTRVAVFLTVLLVVNSGSPSWAVPALIGGGGLMSGCLCLAYIRFCYGIRLTRINITMVQARAGAGFKIFIGNAAVICYRDANVLLLGASGAPETAIAGYSVAEKMVKAFQAIARPLNQYYLPQALAIAKRAGGPSPTVFGSLWRVTRTQALLLMLCALLAIAAYYILVPAMGWLEASSARDNIVLLMVYMVPAVLFGVCNFMFGIAGLNYLGESGYVLRAIITTGILSLLLCYWLASLFADKGAAIAYVGAEMILFSLLASRFWLTRNATVSILEVSK